MSVISHSILEQNRTRFNDLSFTPKCVGIMHFMAVTKHYYVSEYVLATATNSEKPALHSDRPGMPSGACRHKDME